MNWDCLVLGISFGVQTETQQHFWRPRPRLTMLLAPKTNSSSQYTKMRLSSIFINLGSLGLIWIWVCSIQIASRYIYTCTTTFSISALHICITYCTIYCTVYCTVYCAIYCTSYWYIISARHIALYIALYRILYIHTTYRTAYRNANPHCISTLYIHTAYRMYHVRLLCVTN